MKRLMVSPVLVLGCALLAFGQSSPAPERDILSIDKDWATYATQRNATAMTVLNAILADDYTFTGVFGQVLTKAEYLRESASSTTYKPEGVVLRKYSDAAVVTGRINFQYPEGVTLRRQYPLKYDGVRYTNVYVKEQGKWQLVTTQFSPMVEW
jgi:hypothetical protein